MTKLITTDAILFWILFGIWRKDDTPNSLFKLMFLGLAVWNTAALLHAIGW